MGQGAIAKALGVNQKTINRDVAELHQGHDSRVTHTVPLHYSQHVSWGDSLVARLRGEIAEQGLIPTSTEEKLVWAARDLAGRIEMLQRMVASDGEAERDNLLARFEASRPKPMPPLRPKPKRKLRPHASYDQRWCVVVNGASREVS
jgi:hypothetical protein